MTRLAELPPEVRARIARGEARAGRGAAGLHVSRELAAPHSPPAPRFRCHACKLESISWAAAERHARATPHHGRVEAYFEQDLARVEP